MLFKILRGDSSRISLDITPFHAGWCYYTSDDGGFYIDSQEGDGVQKRTRINPEHGDVSRTVDGVLYKDGWSGGKQVLSIEGLLEKQNGVIGVSQDITQQQMDAAYAARLCVAGQADGGLTVAALGVVPQEDIPVTTILLD